MFVGVLNLMHLKAKEKFQNEMVYNSTICFYCQMIENQKSQNEEITQGTNDVKETNEIINCHKCKRAFYHDYDCLKKMKSRHDPICLKYAENWQYVNKIVDNSY
jgi:hypothetical protein